MEQAHGIYIHIPFCRRACSYCDFHFSTRLEYMPAMMDAIRKEIRMRQHEWENKQILSIYFGGGTPGLLPEDELEKFFQIFEELRMLDAVKEITLEVNPENITPEHIRCWNRLGINRLSIGIQSFREEELLWMNRKHKVQENEKALDLAMEFFHGTLSADLLFGTPFLSCEELEKNLHKLIQRNVPHLSCYQLTVEQKTLLQHNVRKKIIRLPDEEEVCRQFLLIHDYLENCGYEHYEISNYAKKGCHAIHNSLYWNGCSYTGLGPSAHSYNAKCLRKINLSNNHEYIRRIQKNEKWFTEEKLSEDNLWNEYILTRFRTKKGVGKQETLKMFGEESWEFILRHVSKLKKEWYGYEEEHIQLTPLGWLVSDSIYLHFMR